MKTAIAIASAAATLLVCSSALAADKSEYWLFNPVPRDLMRELATDRPDQTESAYSVDAGHFQLETDILNATLDRDRSGGGDVRTEAYTAGALNLKLGLLNRVDVQLLFNLYDHVRVEDRVAGTVTEDSGFSDVVTRLKVNLWGNDGGRTALAVMPFVKLPLPQPALRNGDTEGGVIFPFAADLGGGWGLGAHTEFDFVSDGAGGHDVEYFNTITVGRDIVGDLAGYIEFAALVTPDSGTEWQGQVDIGFTYAFGDNVQLDLGCNFGVTDAAPDFNPFLGFTFRY